jgi:uncharacterized protein YbjQ (UPF0145 family)
MQICGCGLVKQSKAGTYTEGDVEYCRNCQRPINAPPSRAVASHSPVSPTRVTTLQSLPGHRITEVHGVVSILSGSSGFTATAKGNEALAAAMLGLRTSAADLGGNAVVGLTGSSFGAAGGITSAFGGDAVGVLLLGTSVTVVIGGPPEAG